MCSWFDVNTSSITEFWFINCPFVLFLELSISFQVPGSISVHFLSPMGMVYVDELARVLRCGFASGFDRLAEASTYVFNAKSSNCISEVSCSLLSFSFLFKFVTNLFKP